MRPTSSSDQEDVRGADRLMGRGLKLTHLRLIAAIDETRQLTAAGRSLRLTQPAASRLLAEAEAIAGHPLCERQPKGIALTPAGEALARRARRVLAEISEAGREIGDVAEGRLGTVRVGAVTAPAIDLVVPILQRLQREHPGLTAQVDVTTSDVLVPDLLRSRHDFVIGRVPASVDPRPLCIRWLGVEPVAFIVRANHPLAQRSQVGIEDLASYDWVMQPPGSLLRRTVEEAFLARGAEPPNCRLSTASLIVTLTRLTRSNSIAPVSTQVARLLAGDGGIGRAVTPLAVSFPLEVKPFGLIRLRGLTLPRSAALLYDAILEAAVRADEAKREP